MGKKVKAILLAIESEAPAELALALNDIGPAKVRMRAEKDGNGDPIPHLDSEGNQVMQPGGFADLTNVQACYDAIKDMVLPTVRRGDLHTYESIMNGTDFDTTVVFNASIDLAIASGDIPTWLGVGLDGNGVKLDGTLRTALTALIGQHQITQALIDSVFAVDDLIEKRFGRLKLGHVAEAIHHRLRGLSL